MRKADNLPPSCTVVMKSRNLNFLEPSGLVTGLIYLYLYLVYQLSHKEVKGSIQNTNINIINKDLITNGVCQNNAK